MIVVKDFMKTEKLNKKVVFCYVFAQLHKTQ